MPQKFQTFFPKPPLYGDASMICKCHMRQCYTYFHKFNFLLPIIMGANLLIGFIRRLQTDMEITTIKGIITMLISISVIAITLFASGFMRHDNLPTNRFAICLNEMSSLLRHPDIKKNSGIKRNQPTYSMNSYSRVCHLYGIAPYK